MTSLEVLGDQRGPKLMQNGSDHLRALLSVFGYQQLVEEELVGQRDLGPPRR